MRFRDNAYLAWFLDRQSAICDDSGGGPAHRREVGIDPVHLPVTPTGPLVRQNIIPAAAAYQRLNKSDPFAGARAAAHMELGLLTPGEVVKGRVSA